MYPRRDLYLAYARLFDFPTAPLARAARDGSIESTLQELHARAGVAAPAPARTPLDAAALEQVYIATFEVGIPEPPVPLYETAYLSDSGRGRMEVLEEVVRFYEFFDLKPTATPREMPDHLTLELELLAALAHMEGAARDTGASPDPFRLAQRDFLERHLLPMLDAMSARRIPEDFYRQLLHGLRAAAAAHLDACRLPEGPDPQTVREPASAC